MKGNERRIMTRDKTRMRKLTLPGKLKLRTTNYLNSDNFRNLTKNTRTEFLLTFKMVL